MLINGPEIEIENEYEKDMENLLISHDKEMMSSKYVPFYVLMSGPKKSQQDSNTLYFAPFMTGQRPSDIFSFVTCFS